MVIDKLGIFIQRFFQPTHLAWKIGRQNIQHNDNQHNDIQHEHIQHNYNL